MADIERNDEVMEMAELQTAEDAERVSGEVVEADNYDDESGDGLAYVVGGAIGAAATAAVYGITKLVKHIKKKRAEKKAADETQDNFAAERKAAADRIAELEAQKKEVEDQLAQIKESEENEE